MLICRKLFSPKLTYNFIMMNKIQFTVLAILLIVGILSNQSTTYLLKAQDSGLQPLCAYNMYQRAGMLWPPLHLNSEFKKRITEFKLFKDVYGSSAEITAYFKLDAPEQDIRSFIMQLEDTPGISSVRYVRRDEALESYKQLHNDDPLLLENISSEAIPESLEIELDKRSFAESIGEILKNNSLVEEVLFKDYYKSDCSDI